MTKFLSNGFPYCSFTLSYKAAHITWLNSCPWCVCVGAVLSCTACQWLSIREAAKAVLSSTSSRSAPTTTSGSARPLAHSSPSLPRLRATPGPPTGPSAWGPAWARRCPPRDPRERRPSHAASPATAVRSTPRGPFDQRVNPRLSVGLSSLCSGLFFHGVSFDKPLASLFLLFTPLPFFFSGCRLVQRTMPLLPPWRWRDPLTPAVPPVTCRAPATPARAARPTGGKSPCLRGERLTDLQHHQHRVSLHLWF